MNQLRSAFARSIGFGLLLLVANVSLAATVIVSPGDLKGWFATPGSTGTASLSTTRHAGNQAGPGALQLALDGSQAGRRVNEARFHFPIHRVNELTALG